MEQEDQKKKKKINEDLACGKNNGSMIIEDYNAGKDINLVIENKK